MNNEAMLNIIRREIDRAISARKHQRHGVIDSYDPEKHAAKVKFMPEEQISGWLPVGTLWSGNQWGLFSPPSPGDHVTIHYERGDIGSSVIVHRHWNDVDKPLKVDAGEMWAIHKEQQGFKLKNDKTFDLLGQSSTKQTFDDSGNVVTLIPTVPKRHEFKRNANDVLSKVLTEDGPSSVIWAKPG